MPNEESQSFNSSHMEVFPSSGAANLHYSLDTSTEEENPNASEVVTPAPLNITNASSSSNNEDREVKEFMCRRIRYFFMSPKEKFFAKRRIPYKLFLVAFKIFLVTTQLVLFGFVLSHHVIFGYNANLVFKHNYLKDWDSSHETLPYPPSTGPNAIYNQDDFFLAIGFAIKNYNNTMNQITNGFKHPEPNPTVKLKHVYFEDNTPKSASSDLVEQIIKLRVNDLTEADCDNVEALKKFLLSKNCSVNFGNFDSLTIEFDLLSPLVVSSYWFIHRECYRFTVRVEITNSYQSGLLMFDLNSEYGTILCQTSNVGASNEQVANLASSTVQLPFRQPSRKLSLLIDVTVLITITASIMLVIRSFYRSAIMYRDTCKFFKIWYNITLKSVFTSFFTPWYFIIVISDLFILSGTLIKISIESRIMEYFQPCSYLLGIGTTLVWIGILRYFTYSYKSSLLLLTIMRAVPAMMQFMVCALILYFAFVFCAWVVIGPYHIKFRTLYSTLECLFSLINGDDMYATFSAIDSSASADVVLFHRVYLYLFIVLFIYFVLNLFLTIIFESYEAVKSNGCVQNKECPLWLFLERCEHDCHSPLFKQDEQRPDRQFLLDKALGNSLGISGCCLGNNLNVDRLEGQEMSISPDPLRQDSAWSCQHLDEQPLIHDDENVPTVSFRVRGQ